MKKPGILVLLVISIFVLIGLDPARLSTAEQKIEKLRIGALWEISGGASPWGIPMMRAMEMAADKINAQGGIKVGDKKYEIELVKADAKSNFDVALSQANRLIFDEKVKYINGPILSGASLAILPVTEANKVVVMHASASPKTLGPDKPHAFRLYPSMCELMGSVFQTLAKDRSAFKKVGLLGPNDESGWGTSEIGKGLAKEGGIEVVFEDFYQRGTTDFFPVLTKVMAKNPDVLIPHALSGGDMALLLQQSRQLGYKGLIFAASNYEAKTMVAKAGPAAEGFRYQAPDFVGTTATPMMRELLKTYEERYKDSFDPAGVGNEYHQLFVLKQAIEKAGTIDTTSVARAMESLEGEIYLGRFSFGGIKTYGIRHQIAYPIPISEIKGGKQVGVGSVIVPVP